MKKSLTNRPKKVKRKRKHGFLGRMRSRSGQKIVAHRRRTGRRRVTV